MQLIAQVLANGGSPDSSRARHLGACMMLGSLAVLAASCGAAGQALRRSTSSAVPRSSSTTTPPSAPRATSTTTTTGVMSTTTVSPVEGLSIVSAGAVTAVAGSAFVFVVSTTCQSGVSIQATGLPRGLRLAGRPDCSATIAGTPSSHDVGVHRVTLHAASTTGETTSQHLVLTVNEAPNLQVRRSLMATVGAPFVWVLSATGEPPPLISTTTVLPVGISLVNEVNGRTDLRGTPGLNSGGVYPITIVASNGVGSPSTAVVVLTVDDAPRFTSPPVSEALAAGVPMQAIFLTASGQPDPVLRASGLPPGVTLTDHGDGSATLSGVPGAPKAPRTYRVIVRARNRIGAATLVAVLTVRP